MASPAPRKLHVLIADDQPLNLRLAVQVLRTLGHGGVAVKDGEQALNAWRQQTFDLLLLDVRMPQLDGLSTLRHIRAEERATGRHLPIVMVTGDDLPEAAQTYHSEGADAVLIKPLEAKQLETILRQIGLV
ncbi:MAG: response regulator [Curvibacter sp.]|nr:response regulator [Curvibacter sp.]